MFCWSFPSNTAPFGPRGPTPRYPCPDRLWCQTLSRLQYTYVRSHHRGKDCRQTKNHVSVERPRPSRLLVWQAVSFNIRHGRLFCYSYFHPEQARNDVRGSSLMLPDLKSRTARSRWPENFCVGVQRVTQIGRHKSFPLTRLLSRGRRTWLRRYSTLILR